MRTRVYDELRSTGSLRLVDENSRRGIVEYYDFDTGEAGAILRTVRGSLEVLGNLYLCIQQAELGSNLAELESRTRALADSIDGVS